MASNNFFMNRSSKTILLFFVIILCSSLQYFSVSSFEFEVGDTKGWIVPPANDSNIYNKWASEKRFQMDDTIHFKYGKDSVMLVTETEYKQCNSTHPIFFSNNGNTIFKFDRSGFFYFISGVSGHCERGQKMIIKVMAPEDDTPPSGGDNNPPSSSNAVLIMSSSVSKVVIQFVLLFVGSSVLLQ
ncbi:Plastocyanin-like [Macleaya cordata]|uniref:Plastocyanin-like n=1 Tax=Macleaya cordata TaxID=56857 RepID=A0A200R4F9_MACCD|nr:Plastocyanin-like [Macleaya cordata]